jgi:hypothetical protein
MTIKTGTPNYHWFDTKCTTSICQPVYSLLLALNGANLANLNSLCLGTSPVISYLPTYIALVGQNFLQPSHTNGTILHPSYFIIHLNQTITLKMEALQFYKTMEHYTTHRKTKRPATDQQLQ